MKFNLKPYGLNTYEAEAYTALVQQGISSAHELSKRSKVPYGKIYPVLAALEQKGFVKKYDGTPQRFMAVEPKVAIEEAVRKQEHELKQLREQSQRLITTLGTLSGKKPKEPLERVRIIEGYKNYLNLSVELHKQVKQEWRSISELSTYKPHLDAYRDCIKRGVKVRMLTSNKEATPEKVEMWKAIGVELRMIEFMPTKFSIIDANDVTLRIATEEKYVSLWVQNPSLAESLRTYFDFLWEKAESV